MQDKQLQTNFNFQVPFEGVPELFLIMEKDSGEVLTKEKINNGHLNFYYP